MTNAELREVRNRVEELHAFYTLRGKSFCGEQAAGHVLELCDIARKALEERDNEMHDVMMLAEISSKVFDHVTGGKASKPNTDASVICALADEVCNEVADEHAKEMTEHLTDDIAHLQRRLEEAEKLINEIRPRPSGCREYDDTCWACRAVKWMEDKQDADPDE